MTTPLDAPDAADTTATIAPPITEPNGSDEPTGQEADAAALAEAPAIESIPADEPAIEVTPRPSARDINDQIRYTAYTVYSRVGDLEGTVEDATAELAALVDELSGTGVQIRGFYDVSTMRADADLLIWWHAATAEDLQAAARKLRRTVLGRTLVQSWSAMGLHRPAEFNKGHIPAFLAGMAAKEWVCVYPFVRSYEWYLLPETERRGMLVEHGMMGREYNQVLSNTVAAFALGDYEWLLALEADELHDIIDLMRHLRASEARMHVREEIPFFTGRRLDIPGVIEVLA